jgi:hypothetical protein
MSDALVLTGHELPRCAADLTNRDLYHDGQMEAVEIICDHAHAPWLDD